jgi:hypothetical protein
MAKPVALTAKQAAFIQEYLVDLNATQAAIRSGYSAKTANVAGPRLLLNVRILTAIAKRQAAKAKHIEVTADRIIAELALIGFAPVGHKHVRPETKRAALVDLGKHLGLFKDKLVVTGTLTLEALVAASMADEVDAKELPKLLTNGTNGHG